MRSLFILLILSIAFQGIHCDCYSSWKEAQTPMFYQCLAPYGYSYNNTNSYATLQACIIVNRLGCYRYGSSYYPSCKEGYTLTFPLTSNVCTAQCPSGYSGQNVNSKYICSKPI